MKKLLLISILATLLVSCDSDNKKEDDPSGAGIHAMDS